MSLDVFECVARGTLTPELGAQILRAERATWLDRLVCRIRGHADRTIAKTQERVIGCVRCGRMQVPDAKA